MTATLTLGDAARIVREAMRGDIYTDWDDERLAITLAEIYGEDE